LTVNINKKKSKNYHTVGAAPKYNRTIIKRRKIDTPKIHIHDRSLSYLGTGTPIKSRGVKLVLPVYTSSLVK